jgi:hypothetical protein
MPVRKNQAALSADEKARFVSAVLQLKANGTYDQFVRVHRDAMMDAAMPAHMMPAFLPWHREYLRRLEIELQRLDPTVTIPYWDWTVDRQHSASLWSDDFLGAVCPPNGGPHFAEVDIGLGNPFGDLTGFFIHFGELLNPGRTDHIKLRSALAKTKASEFLYYTAA